MKIALDKASYRSLLNSGSVPKEALEPIYKQAELSGQPFLKLLREAGVIKEEVLLEIFSKTTGCPVISLKTASLDSAVFSRVPVKFASYYKFFPIRQENGKLLIATSRILDIHTLDEIRFALGFDVGVCFAPEKEILEMIQKYYGLAADTVDKILAETSAQDRPAMPTMTQEVEDIEKLAQAPSVAHVVNQIILDAYKKRASDIHLEPLQSGIRLRYRVDGLLQEAPVPRELKEFFSPMLSRIKIMANLNVAEKRLPQDGKLRVKTLDETLDLRVSFIPTANGESVVIRILPGKNVFKLEQLGFESRHLKVFEELLGKHNGIIFVTGPTGSGKSTTLYAALNKLNLPGRKIITIEDPVEYELEGISQIHVNPEIGLTFSNGLRSMLRQDPDVMMVGEVRDLETADIAIRAALTGHLILSTLHTNDAASGVTRLLDIGVEPYLIASSVVAFIAQRLIRVNCTNCKTEDKQVPLEVKELIEAEYGIPQGDIHVFRGTGCEECGHTGFRGRIAIHEFLPLTEPLRKLIMDRMTAESIKTEAVRQGMTTLRHGGWEKVLAGLTTPEEVMETTEEDGTLLLMDESTDVGVKEEKLPSFRPGPKTAGAKRQDFQYINVRKFQRMACDVPVLFRVIDYHGTNPVIQAAQSKFASLEFEGVTRDISGGGVYFSIPDQRVLNNANVPGESSFSLVEAIESGSILEIKILLPNGEKPVKCMAKKLRFSKSLETVDGAAESFCRVGVSFLSLDSEDRCRLLKFLKMNRKSDEAV
ncbi:MAG: ATPase, T2SS/T4P/T4SS family [Candidatus Omnitrophica bacterium]|nr:ATPase, T2SS/T4P/T4SS family [Candidatus Omnitrophota bacterium]